jgi:four helix bundle protein
MRFEDLEVWRRSVALSADIYLAMKNLKDYGFKDQITRSSLSIPSNIAEGIERGSDNEVIRFCTIARGSCGELRTQVYIGMKIGYIDTVKGDSWLKETIEISAMICGFIKFRQRKSTHD